MSPATAKTALWSNNASLESIFLSTEFEQPIHFVDYKYSSDCPYVLVLVDLTADLKDISQKIISVYDSCRRQTQKLIVAIFHGEKIEVEKNLYFTQMLDKLGDSSPLHRLIFVKDLYHDDILSPETWLEKYIQNSLSSRKIIVSRKGENKLYPLTIRDFVAGLQKVFFLSGTAGKNFWLVGEPISDLDLAYLLKKDLDDIDDQFEIVSTGENFSELDLNSLGNQTKAVLNWEANDDFALSLKKAVRQIGEDRTLLISHLHRAENKSKKPTFLRKIYRSFLNRKNNRQKSIETSRELLIRIGELFFITAAGVYLLITLGFVGFTGLSLQRLEISLGQTRGGDIKSAVNSLQQSTALSRAGEISYSFVSPLFAALAPSFHEKNHNLFVFMEYSQTSLENLQQTYLLAEKIYHSIGNQSDNLNYRDISLALQSNLSQVYENVNQIRLLTQTGKLPQFLETNLQANPEFKNIPLVEQQITQLLKTIEIVPAFLVGDTAKNIIILFQNTEEIRSTGGTVDYLLALVMDHGRLVSHHLYSASDMDTLIPADLTAPPLVNLYTGSNKWQLRDLNYNPDFSSTASNFSVVISKSLNIKPDIIMAVNNQLISDLLVEDKGVVLNGQNVTAETFQAEISTLSPSPLYAQLIEHYLTNLTEHRLSLATLGRVLTHQSLTGQLLFWTADDQLEKNLADQTFSGTVLAHSCHPAIPSNVPCLSETTYLNESNFSLIGVGGDLKKRITHRIAFLSGGVKHTYVVDYRFIKEFKNLNRDLNIIIQLYAPANSVLGPVTLNGKVLSAKSVLKQKDNNLERFQMPLALLFNRDNQLQIEFTSSVPSTALPFAYSLTEYRQPGLIPGESNVELALELPGGSRASLVTSPAISTPTGYNFIYPDKTSSFGIVFEPK